MKLPRMHPLTWTKDIICAPFFTQKDRAVITTVMYSIWTSRNNLTHGDVGFVPAKSMEMIKETLQALEMSRDGDFPKSIRPCCKWKEPLDGTVKIN